MKGEDVFVYVHMIMYNDRGSARFQAVIEYYTHGDGVAECSTEQTKRERWKQSERAWALYYT